MISLRRTGRLTTLLVTALLIAGAHSARANDPDLRATTVPASSCQLVTNSQAAGAVFSSGSAWTFNSTSAGTITLHCPLPINANTEFDASNTNNMTMIRIFYLDPDGMGAGSEITVRLLFRNPANNPVGAVWSSNSSNVMIATTAVHPLFHPMQFPALYSFEVRLSRTTTDDKVPVFYGIDFP